MKIAIASDHGGFELKEEIISFLKPMNNIEILDLGPDIDQKSVDYPDYGAKAAHVVISGEADRAIIMCGTGIGISIAANKFPGIRAALCHDTYTARMSRAHNDANILAMGGRTTGKEIARDMVKIWLETAFEGDRHQRRLDKISRLEENN